MQGVAGMVKVAVVREVVEGEVKEEGEVEMEGEEKEDMEGEMEVEKVENVLGKDLGVDYTQEPKLAAATRMVLGWDFEQSCIQGTVYGGIR